jgi:NAD(P)-dependent dehydrogenase (short-subunit alcohol dehydrogenase family)
MNENIPQPLTGKTAIVTGGTRGIGRAISERLLTEGAQIAVCGATQQSVDHALAALGPRDRTFGMPADVSQIEDVRRFVSSADARFGGVDILINNAGAGLFRSVAELSPEEWRHIIGLNLTGAYYCCHEVLPIFRNRGGGDIINISSLAGKNAFAGGAAYNASKFGLNGFSEAMMLDHRNEGIRVATIMPGSVDTDFGGKTPPAAGELSKSGSQSGNTEAERLKNAWKIQPEDVAEIVMMLLKMPRRTTISQIEVRPSRPPGK